METATNRQKTKFLVRKGAHGPSGTTLFLSSLCPHVSYGLGLWIATCVTPAKVFEGDTQPDFKREAAQ
jgi:hypothetical protein